MILYGFYKAGLYNMFNRVGLSRVSYKKNKDLFKIAHTLFPGGPSVFFIFVLNQEES